MAAAPQFEVAKLTGEINVPKLREGAMAGIKAYVASEKIGRAHV